MTDTGAVEAVSLEEVADYLNLPALPEKPTKLQQVVLGCTSRLSQEAGILLAQDYTETYDGGDVSIWLRHTPVLSIASVVEVIGLMRYDLTEQPVGQPVDNFGFSLDEPLYGRITRRSAGSQVFPFYANTGNVTVTYTAGVSPVPYNVKLALLEFVAHIWQIGQEGEHFSTGSGAAFGVDDRSAFTSNPAAYAVPNRVLEMLGTDRRLPTIA